MARKSMKTSTAITPVEYSGLQAAYDHFNKELFGGTLPDVFITYQRKARSLGYFSADRFNGRVDKTGRHELALNPDGFVGCSDKEDHLDAGARDGACLATRCWYGAEAGLSRPGVGGEDEADRLAADLNWDGGRSGNRTAYGPLHHSRRQVRAGLRQACCVELSA